MSGLKEGKPYRVRYACEHIGATEIEGILYLAKEEGVVILKKVAIPTENIISISKLRDGTEDVYDY